MYLYIVYVPICIQYSNVSIRVSMTVNVFATNYWVLIKILQRSKNHIKHLNPPQQPNRFIAFSWMSLTSHAREPKRNNL